MNPIADYKAEAIARLIEPDLKRKVSPQEVRSALDGLRRGGTATIDELAAAWGIVRGDGIQPTLPGWRASGQAQEPEGVLCLVRHLAGVP